jgi:hypothetical protein
MVAVPAQLVSNRSLGNADGPRSVHSTGRRAHNSRRYATPCGKSSGAWPLRTKRENYIEVLLHVKDLCSRTTHLFRQRDEFGVESLRRVADILSSGALIKDEGRLYTTRTLPAGRPLIDRNSNGDVETDAEVVLDHCSRNWSVLDCGTSSPCRCCLRPSATRRSLSCGSA